MQISFSSVFLIIILEQRQYLANLEWLNLYYVYIIWDYKEAEDSNDIKKLFNLMCGAVKPCITVVRNM